MNGMNLLVRLVMRLFMRGAMRQGRHALRRRGGATRPGRGGPGGPRNWQPPRDGR